MAPARVATRLTCFALISAIENDLRNSIRLAVAQIGRDVFPDDVRARAKKRWEEDNAEGIPLGGELDLFDYIDFADLGKIIYGIAAMHGFDAHRYSHISPALPYRSRTS